MKPDALGVLLDGSALLVVVCAIATILLPHPVGSWTGWAMVALLVMANVARICLLCARWHRESDHRFFVVGLVLVALIVIGGAGSVWWAVR